MNRLLSCVAICLLVGYASCTLFSDCGSKTGKVISLSVTNCPDDADNCILKRGTKADIDINFTAEGVTNTLQTSVHGIIGSVPLPFPLPQSNACETGVTCPVKKGETYHYHNSLDIREAYPAIDVTVRWELKDDKGQDMVCIEIPCTLQ